MRPHTLTENERRVTFVLIKKPQLGRYEEEMSCILKSEVTIMGQYKLKRGETESRVCISLSLCLLDAYSKNVPL